MPARLNWAGGPVRISKFMTIGKIFLVIFLVLAARLGFAQFTPSPDLDWYTLETEHFYIHYHTGTERTANTVAKIAEEIYGPITSLYGFKPKDKTSWIITDASDYSNGATDYYGNRIEIQASSLDFELRGTHDWLRNVVTHEFTHCIQVPSSMKFSQRVPAIYFQFLNYENERRPDVLYGYPNVIVSYPYAGSLVPSWFAEGTAQYQRQQTGYDNWDSHRDMILRMRTLNNDLLSWNEMGQFASYTTYKAESIYNSGLNLVRYISEHYGEDKLREVSGYMGNVFALDCEGAFKKATGKTGRELYDEWKAYLQKDYADRIKDLKQFVVEGKEIDTIGFANYFPKYSPDGKTIAYLSGKSGDYGGTALWLHYIDGKKEDKPLVPAVSGGFDWSPDGKEIIFSRRNPPNIHESSTFDIYEYNIAKDKEKQVTFGLRAHSPAYSADGTQISFVENGDGTQNLYVAPAPKNEKLKDIRKVTDFKNGEQIYSPAWYPNSSLIVFDYSKEDARSIAKLDLSSGDMEFLFQDTSAHLGSDFRNPVFSKDGSELFLASDMTGIFNIYKYRWINEARMPRKLDRIRNLTQLTNALGGAFMPSVDSTGNLTFASWQAGGYKINLLENYKDLDSAIDALNARYKAPDKVVMKYAEQTDSTSVVAKDRFNWAKLKNFADTGLVIKHGRPYTNVAIPLFLTPVLRFDNYSKTGNFLDIIKPGLYFYSEDVLGKMGIFGGADIDRLGERDLYLQFDYDNGVPFFKDFFNKVLSFVPHFTIAGYNVSRKVNSSLVAGIDTIPVGVTYDLLEFDFNMAFKIINANHTLNAGLSYSHYSSDLSTFLIPQTQIQVPASSTNYFNGRDLSLTYTYSSFKPYRNDDINPIGRRVQLKYDYQFSYLNPTLVVDNSGNVQEVLSQAKFHQLELDWLEAVGLFGSNHSLSLRLRGGGIFGNTQDQFFDFYASGYPNMKGYPFYAIGGNKYATANLTYRFPLVQDINFKFLQFYFDKMFLSVYGDWGDAWNGKSVTLQDFKKDAGIELRLQSFSFYEYPTSFAFNAAYGFDQFTELFPSSTSVPVPITYGKQWRYYFTVLFSFDAFEDMAKKMRF